MSERPIQDLSGAYIRTHEVKLSSTVRKGFAVKFDSSDIVEAAAVTDNAFGIALEAGTSGASGTKAKVRVAYFGYPAIVPALVGTGGATRGAPAKFVSDGSTDATVGGGTTKLRVFGTWAEAGVAADLAGLNIGTSAWTVGS